MLTQLCWLPTRKINLRFRKFFNSNGKQLWFQGLLFSIFEKVQRNYDKLELIVSELDMALRSGQWQNEELIQLILQESIVN
jgi:hypothetical protein